MSYILFRDPLVDIIWGFMSTTILGGSTIQLHSHVFPKGAAKNLPWPWSFFPRAISRAEAGDFSSGECVCKRSTRISWCAHKCGAFGSGTFTPRIHVMGRTAREAPFTIHVPFARKRRIIYGGSDFLADGGSLALPNWPAQRVKGPWGALWFNHCPRR